MDRKALPLVWLLAAPLLAQEKAAPAKPDPVGLAVAALEKGLLAKEPEQRAAALAAVEVDDAKVAQAAAKAFADPDPRVRRAAILVLRYQKSAEALTLLLRANERFQEDEELGPAYFLALGQHGSNKALPVLLDDAMNDKTQALFAARMAAVAHVRSARSIEALLELAGKRATHRWQGHAQQIGRALRTLAGDATERGIDEWRAWWKEHGKTFVVAKEPSGLPKGELAEYRRLWREPRGGDGEAGEGEQGKGRRRRG